MNEHLTDDQRRGERRRGGCGPAGPWGIPGGRRRGAGFGPGGGCGPGGEHHGPHHHRGFGPFGRARRGMIKAAVFAALAEGPMHGYQIMQRIEELSGGVWRPSPGSIYPTLQELEDRELVKAEEVEGKRIYSLTDTGKAEAEKLRDGQGQPPWWTGEGASVPRMKLRQAVGSLAAAARQVGSSGSDDAVEKTLEILADARKRIYGLLAEGE